MTIGELVFNLGFKADTMKLKDFGRAVADLNVSSILSAGSFGALIETAKKFIDIAQGMGEGINKFTMETDGSSEAIQKWVKVGEKAGVTGGVVEDTIRGIRRSMDELRGGGIVHDSAFWTTLGLGPELLMEKDPSKMFGVMMQRLQAMGSDQARLKLERFGKSTELLDILKQFPNLQEAYNKAQGLSEAQLAKINTNMMMTKQLSQDIQLIWADMGTTLLPALDKIILDLDGLLTKIRSSKDFMALLHFYGKAFEGAGQVGGLLGKGAGNLYNTLTPFASGLVKNQNPAVLPFFSPLAAIQSGMGAQTNVTQHNQIVIQGAHDKEAVAKAVDEHLGRRIDHATASSSTEIR